MAKHASDTSSMELSHYLTVLRRRRALVAGCLVGGVALAVGVIVGTPSSSTASTQVNLNVISSNAFGNSRPDSDLVDPQTEQSMARSTTVTDKVAETLGGRWSRTEVRRSTTATLLPDGTVLRIEFTAPSARVAAQGATLVAEEYLRYRSAIAQSRVDLAAEPLTARSAALRKRLGEENATIANTRVGSQERTAAELRAEELRAELAALSARSSELAAISTTGGEVITEADAEQVTISPNRALVLLSGSLGGLLAGLVAAFVANILDRRVRDSYDVAGAGGGDVVATFGAGEPELPTTGADADEFRALRERLLAGVAAESPVLGVIDVVAGEGGPSDVGVGLALSLADAGVATDLVLAGYGTDLVDRVAADLGMHEVETHGRGRRFRGGVAESLTLVVPESSRPRHATSDLLAELLDDHVRAAEVSVVAVDPSAGASVRLTVGRAAHRTLLVARETETSIDDLSRVAGDLQGIWAVLHGTVLTGPGRRLSAAAAQEQDAADQATAVQDAASSAAAEEAAPETAGVAEQGEAVPASDPAPTVAGSSSEKEDEAPEEEAASEESGPEEAASEEAASEEAAPDGEPSVEVEPAVSLPVGADSRAEDEASTDPTAWALDR